MGVAAIYDIHGNVPALEAVLSDVQREGHELIVVGGDVAWGPMPGETIELLRGLETPVRYVMGNTDREMVAAFDARTSAEDDDDQIRQWTAWCAGRIDRAQRDFLGAFEPTVTVAVDGLGDTLFCHGSPRSDTEIITSLTPEARLEPMLVRVVEPLVVCGHTHVQFDREFLGTRIVNAGAVGLPYEREPAAYWLSLGPDVSLRRSDYDVAAARRVLAAAGFPDVDELIRESLLEPIGPRAASEIFENQAT